MHYTKYLIISFLITILIGCSGSDTYRGKWKATDNSGEEVQISFAPNEINITKAGVTETFEYSQNSVNISNSVETYGVKLDDGRTIQIHFPIANDETMGGILDSNGNVVYIISRKGYLTYDDVYGG